jgi:hypothetical protein
MYRLVITASQRQTVLLAQKHALRRHVLRQGINIA